ncbi:hypothetical protein ACWCYY_18540 [Kitasatospora sp. NPDC001664]|uniref:hypothetical protein n=1 Tax=Kitasatospora albolonga TaxID=68173 RepID=UPI0035E86FE0
MDDDRGAGIAMIVVGTLVFLSVLFSGDALPVMGRAFTGAVALISVIMGFVMSMGKKVDGDEGRGPGGEDL